MHRILLLSTLLIIPFVGLLAQPGNPTDPAPIDGGLTALAAGGAYLGYLYKTKLKQQK